MNVAWHRVLVGQEDNVRVYWTIRMVVGGTGGDRSRSARAERSDHSATNVPMSRPFPDSATTMEREESVPNAVRPSLRSHRPAMPTLSPRSDCARSDRQVACSVRKAARSTAGGSGHGSDAQPHIIAVISDDVKQGTRTHVVVSQDPVYLIVRELRDHGGAERRDPDQHKMRRGSAVR